MSWDTWGGGSLGNIHEKKVPTRPRRHFPRTRAPALTDASKMVGASFSGAFRPRRPRAIGERGSVMVEYVVLLAGVSLVCATALIAVGGLLVASSRLLQAWLVVSFP